MKKRKERRYEIKIKNKFVNKNSVSQSFFSKILNYNVALALKKSGVFALFFLIAVFFVNAGDVIIQNGKINVSDAFYFDGSSNLGIGTSSPDTKLHVTDDIKVNNSKFEVVGIADYHNDGFRLNEGSTYWTVSMGQISTSGDFIISSYDGAWQDFFTILNESGNVGIGTSNPANKLTVKVEDNADGMTVFDSGSQGSITFYPNSSSGYANGLTQPGDKRIIFSEGNIDTGNLVIGPWSSFASGMRITSGGYVGIATSSPNDALDVVGDIDATGCVQTDDSGSIGGTCVSDLRFKENIKPLQNSLDKIAQLRPVSYQWKKEFFDVSKEKGSNVGLIAQEFEKVFPELVKTDENGYKKIRYDIELEMHLIQAIKELKAENDALKQLVCQDHPEAKICN